MTDHHGNILAPAKCPSCRACWVYIRMADQRGVSFLGRCIYGGPFMTLKRGYAAGEVEAKMRERYGRALGTPPLPRCPGSQGTDAA